MTDSRFLNTFTHKDNTIGLTRSGQFLPFVGENSGPIMNTLRAAEEYIDSEISKVKTKRIKHDVPCLVLNRKYQKATYRGIHLTSGDPMVTIAGEKTTVKRYQLFRLPPWEGFEQRLEEYRKARQITREFDHYIHEFKVSVPAIQYSDDASQVSEKEKLLAERLQK